MKKCVYSDYVHTDRLGSVVNLTDQYGRVPAQIDYDDWGKVTAYQSLNISGGYRTVLPEITYAGHQYDDVLGMYYAKARMYDAENRRFAGVDPVKGRITEPMTMVQYLYVVGNPLRWVDLLGLKYSLIEGTIAHIEISALIKLFHPDAIIGPTIYGLKRTKSGRGYADVVHPTVSGVDVYEIKSEQYKPGKKYATKGINQLDSYIQAINLHPSLNPNFSNAQPGTFILSGAKSVPVVIPYLPNLSKVIEVTTDYDNAPGMIFYEIRPLRKNEVVTVKAEDFITDDDLDRINYYCEEFACPQMPSWDNTFIDIDTIQDLEMNADVLDWLNSVTVDKVQEGWYTYAQLIYPDGTTFYSCLGIGPTWLNTAPAIPSSYSLFQMYNSLQGGSNKTMYDDRGNIWAPSPTPIFTPGTIPVIPGGNEILVPVH